MKVVLQRVSKSSVSVEGEIVASIGCGATILVGFKEDDTIEEIEKIAKKIINLRIFDDVNGIMNLSIKDINGDIIIVSQFTLYAQTAKGNRPSYIKAAKSEIAIPLYQMFKNIIERELGKEVQTGRFGADMAVSIDNDGPVTIIIDSEEYKK